MTVVNERIEKGGMKEGMRPQPVSDSNDFATSATGDCVLSVEGGSPSRGDSDTQEVCLTRQSYCFIIFHDLMYF